MLDNQDILRKFIKNLKKLRQANKIGDFVTRLLNTTNSSTLSKTSSNESEFGIFIEVKCS